MSTYAESATEEGNVLDNRPLQKKSVLATDEQATILDETWARQAFLVQAGDMDDIDVRNRTFSSVHLKFTDTSLGGAYAINSKPQFTRYADVRSKGRLAGRYDTTIGAINGKVGMGRYYSEAIDDTSQIIHMRFGVPQYNSLTKFFTGFYNLGAGRLARNGRTSSFFSKVGKGIGLVAQIIIWPIVAVQAIGYVARFFFDRPTSKFYYMKPTMFVYWSAVNSLVNKIAVGKGLLPLVLKHVGDQPLNKSYELDPEALARLSELLPDVLSKDGGFDIYAAANRAERMRIAADNKAYEEADNTPGYGLSDFYGYVKKTATEELRNDSYSPRDLTDRLANFLQSESTDDNGGKDSFEKDIKQDPNNPDKPRAPLDKFWNYLKTELNDGAAFATFRVDYTGPVSESFSNSVRDSDIQSKMNGMASAGRSTSFSFAGGSNIGGTVGSILDAATSAAKDLATGVLDSMQLTGLVQLSGAAFVDIPKHWDSSSASLPKSSYTMQLVSPYGNVVSQMQNIYIPLSMLLAAALPLSTGKQSYTSPFLCELWDRGRHQTRLGMIDSLQITRGTSTLGFNSKGQAMAVDVSFTVVDMSSIMHMQIAQGFLSNDENGVFDEETVFSDYMNTLGSVSLHEQFHTIPKLRLRAARSLRNLQSLTSPAAWASFVKNETPVGWAEVMFRGTSR